MRKGENLNKTYEIENQCLNGIVFEGENIDGNGKISPDKDKLVILQGDNKIKTELLKKNTYIDGSNFRLQIGKMQEDGETIYSEDVLRCLISYLIKHTEKDGDGNGKAIIQLWPTLAQELLQDETDKNKILNYDDEKIVIQNLLDKFGDLGKLIEIQNVADNYPDIFKVLKKGKEGIIPDNGPELENFIFPLQSPLEIIRFLAYNAKNDEDLMQLFYNTKPEKYKEIDKRDGIKPGESNSDYYSIVEVGIRLYEILNGVHIQGGIDRQKVYDRIISLIIFGEDKISTKGKCLNILNYPSLQKLHNRIKTNYQDIVMEQLYIDLSKLDDIKRKRQKQEEAKKKENEINELKEEIKKKNHQLLINEEQIENLQRIISEEEKLRNAYVSLECKKQKTAAAITEIFLSDDSELKKKENELIGKKKENEELKKRLSTYKSQLDKLENERQKIIEEIDEIKMAEKKIKWQQKKETIKSIIKKTGIGLGVASVLAGPPIIVDKYGKIEKNRNDFIERNKVNGEKKVPQILVDEFQGVLDLNKLKKKDREDIENLFILNLRSNEYILQDWINGKITTEYVITKFWEVYGGMLIQKYKLSFMPYDLFKQYSNAIENTINHEIIEPMKFSATTDGKIYGVTGHFNGGDKIYYIIRVIVDDGLTKKGLLFASSSGFGGPYTLYDGFRVASGINYFTSAKYYVPEIFDNTILNNTKQRITHGNFSLDIDIGKKKEYTMESGGGSNCYIYSLYDATTVPNICVSQCDEDNIIIYDDFVSRGISTGFRGKYYFLVRVPIGGKEYLLVGDNPGGGLISTEMLGNIDKKYLNYEEILALENSLDSGLSIKGACFLPHGGGSTRFLNIQIYKPNYSFAPLCAIDKYNTSKITIGGEDFYINIFDCGNNEGELLFAAKGFDRGSFTLENGKIVAEYLKKFKDCINR